jgi:hypothetical protein
MNGWYGHKYRLGTFLSATFYLALLIVSSIVEEEGSWNYIKYVQKQSSPRFRFIISCTGSLHIQGIKNLTYAEATTLVV